MCRTEIDCKRWYLYLYHGVQTVQNTFTAATRCNPVQDSCACVCWTRVLAPVKCIHQCTNPADDALPATQYSILCGNIWWYQDTGGVLTVCNCSRSQVLEARRQVAELQDTCGRVYQARLRAEQQVATKEAEVASLQVQLAEKSGQLVAADACAASMLVEASNKVRVHQSWSATCICRERLQVVGLCLRLCYVLC
jgi:hypothetical protein